jgi:deoxyribodipyrimidine photo-lyase
LKNCLASPTQPPAPIREPHAPLAPPPRWPQSLPLEELQIEPAKGWPGAPADCWSPGSAGAQAGLAQFLDCAIECYPTEREFPGRPGVSRLSPYLHFGEISPRSVWYAVQNLKDERRNFRNPEAPDAFLRQLVWREFAHHLLFHFPGTAVRPMREEFERFPWRRAPKEMEAWKLGRTGYPIVDAGMRELRTTGSMHNRVRMVVASFLTKHLLQPWQEGARWFWEMLVDADLSNNTFGWQWTAGCGADAAPYFRIFNPVTQGEKFDPGGDYVRRWVPELAGVESKWIHRPWEAPASAGRGTREYPGPIVEHSAARTRALAAYSALK